MRSSRTTDAEIWWCRYMKLHMNSSLLSRPISFLLVMVAYLGAASELLAAAPVVSNVQANQRPGSQLVDISYTVADADGGTVTVTVLVSADGGTNWDVPVF